MSQTMHYPGLKQPANNPLPKVSEKRAIINRKEYNPVVKQLKKEKPDQTCEINSPVCIKTPVHPHHTEGRVGKKLSKKESLLLACDPCNHYIESHPEWAKALGFKKSKHEKNYQRVK